MIEEWRGKSQDDDGCEPKNSCRPKVIKIQNIQRTDTVIRKSRRGVWDCLKLMPTAIWRAYNVLSLLMCVALASNASAQMSPVSPSSTVTEHSSPIPPDQLGAVAGKQYSGDGLAVTATNDGARLRCAFQRIDGQVTGDGLWLTSTAEDSNNERFRVVASAVGRDGKRSADVPSASSLSSPSATISLKRDIADGTSALLSLPLSGTVEVKDNLVRFIRPGVTGIHRERGWCAARFHH